MIKLLPLLLLYISGNLNQSETIAIASSFDPEITDTISFPISILPGYADTVNTPLCSGNNCKPMGVETIYFSEGAKKEKYITEKKNIVIVKKYKSKNKVVTKTIKIKKVKKILK